MRTRCGSPLVLAVLLGRFLFKLGWIRFTPDGGWRERPAFRWESDSFCSSQRALGQIRSAQRRSRAILLGEAQATIDVASEAVRRMSSSRREREAQPSSETVHHIVKAEVSALDAKVDALQTEVGALKGEVGALKGEVSALKGEVISISGKLDTLISSMIPRETGEQPDV